MARICFASYEIYPTTWGGTGVLLYNAARVLLERGHEVVFLLDVTADEFDRFQYQDRLLLPNAKRCLAYHVESLCYGSELKRADFLTYPQWQAYRFHLAATAVAAREHPDLIEFFDYCGVGYYALAAKVAGLAYQHTHLAIRLHNSLELIDGYEATKPIDIERYCLYALEHGALQLAETVIYPSPSYLRQAYQPLYEPWFGATAWSKSPLVDVPCNPGSRPDAHIVLYYGRVYGFKGVDRFVDAAVALLCQGVNPHLRFALVGHDSRQAPDGSASYEEYLRKKIPPQLQERFEFRGHYTRHQLEQLLPSVLFAVFPSYFESFCYAAHEIYAAGVPIIVADIPGFADFFQHERNALIFDGSSSDLTRTMRRLLDDHVLRRQITLPYSLAGAPLGTFYHEPFPKSWIQPRTGKQPSLLVCVLDDDPAGTARSLAALQRSAPEARVALLRPAREGVGAAAWLLGNLYTLHNQQGDIVDAAELRTEETLLLLRSGDIPASEFIPLALELLGRQPQLSFVSSWRRVGHADTLQTFPLDLALELAPFSGQPPLSRAVMRSEPGKLLIDFFDPQVGVFGELLYLWSIDTPERRGLQIPRVLLTLVAEPVIAPSPSILSYLVMRDNSPWRQARLARYLLAVWSTLGAAQTMPNLAGRLAALELQLREVHHSRAWRLLLRLRQIRAKVRSARRFCSTLGWRTRAWLRPHQRRPGL